MLDGADNSSMVVQQVMGVFDDLYNTYFLHVNKTYAVYYLLLVNKPGKWALLGMFN